MEKIKKLLEAYINEKNSAKLKNLKQNIFKLMLDITLNQVETLLWTKYEKLYFTKYDFAYICYDSIKRKFNNWKKDKIESFLKSVYSEVKARANKFCYSYWMKRGGESYQQISAATREEERTLLLELPENTDEENDIEKEVYEEYEQIRQMSLLKKFLSNRKPIVRLIVARKIKGLDNKEIAQQLNIDTRQVENKIYYFEKDFKKWYQDLENNSRRC
ncbi:MAG: hypothetical protein LBC44_02120 [Mycoplasmataceae bacterium]|nr:hypothetical protein [Mycoplasmataceae bacterium]